MKPIGRNLKKFGSAHARYLASICALVLLSQSFGVAASKIEAEVVSLRDGGFHPPTIQRSTGKFLLIVRNHSITNEMSVGIAGNDGTVISAPVQVHIRSQDYVLDLPAGTYVVTDSSHPSWSSLTITIH